MKRLVVEWSGPPVKGNAVTVLHFADDEAAVSAVVWSVFQDAKALFTTGTTITIPDNGDVIDPVTGTLTGTWSEGGGPLTTVGTSAGNAAAGVGASITWLTGGIVNGKRVRGRTFIVPMYSNLYEADGTLSSGAVTLLNAFGTDLVAGGLSVWHRPTGPGTADGSEHLVTGFRLRDKVAFLSSRRD
jgi:hypothetical protein